MTSSRIAHEIPKPTFLVVEDHEALRNTLRKWLESTFPLCRVLEAKSGVEAIRTACVEMPDIVPMDIGLPEMTGIEATRHLRRAVPQAHVVMLTIHESVDYRVSAAEAGASAYVPKRKMHSDLIPVLTSLLSPPRLGPAQVV
jgi:DNA-binding NarL/FixJ family response regulator